MIVSEALTAQNPPMTDPSDLPLTSFPQGFRAIVIGASGAIGAAMVARLEAHPRCASVIGIGRDTVPLLDLGDASSIRACAASLAAHGPFHLVVHAAGVLHGAGFMPEKRLQDLDAEKMAEVFRLNAFGPAMVLANFGPLLDTGRGVLAVLSAKVGSIGDNRLGGWYSYRASKAALNMFVKTASIEMRRRNPQSVLLALHPGTVDSRLSAPFNGAEIGRAASDAATDLLRVMDRSGPDDSGGFFAYDGEPLRFLIAPKLLSEIVRDHNELYVSPGKIVVDAPAEKKFASREDWLNIAGVLKEEEHYVEGLGLLVLSEITGDARSEIVGHQSVGLLADQKKIDVKTYQRQLIGAGVVDPASPKSDRRPMFKPGDLDRVMKIGGGKIAEIVDVIERLSALGAHAGGAEENSEGTQSGGSTS